MCSRFSAGIPCNTRGPEASSAALSHAASEAVSTVYTLGPLCPVGPFGLLGPLGSRSGPPKWDTAGECVKQQEVEAARPSKTPRAPKLLGLGSQESGKTLCPRNFVSLSRLQVPKKSGLSGLGFKPLNEFPKLIKAAPS